MKKNNVLTIVNEAAVLVLWVWITVLATGVIDRVESHRHLDSDEVKKKLGHNFDHPLSDIEKMNKQPDTDGCCPRLTSCCANGYQSLTA